MNHSTSFTLRNPQQSLSKLLHYVTTVEHVESIPEEYQLHFNTELLKWSAGYIFAKLASNTLLPNIIVHRDKLYLPVFLTHRGKLLSDLQQGRQELYKLSFRECYKNTGLHNYVLIGTKNDS